MGSSFLANIFEEQSNFQLQPDPVQLIWSRKKVTALNGMRVWYRITEFLHVFSTENFSHWALSLKY